ncbi:MAG: Ig-like domain-containing protein [Candidatus Pacebacteria bacterium]|nr:Ig-like domain-containing protein [Candidatus Paceibacterota bacterium]
MSTPTAKRIFLGMVYGFRLLFLARQVAAQGSPAVSQFNPTVIAGPILTVNYEITNRRTPTITGNINSPSAGVYVVINKHTYQGVNNGDGSWAAGVDQTLPDGVYDISAAAIASDGSQIVTSVPKSLVIDTTPPKITVQNNSGADPNVVLSGTVNDPNAQVVVNVGNNAYNATTGGDGTWSLALGNVVPALPPGTYTANVVAGDMAGNVSYPVAARLTIAATGNNPAPTPFSPGNQNQSPSGGQNGNQNSPLSGTDQTSDNPLTSVI